MILSFTRPTAQAVPVAKTSGPDTYSTIGDEKKYNYALQQQTKNDFIKAVTEGLQNLRSISQ